MKPSYLIALLFTMGSYHFSNAEEITVRGRMIDAMTLQPISGGILMVEGTGKGSMADPNGVFVITADTAAFIKLTPTGYEPQIFKARHQLGNITMHKAIPDGEKEYVPTKEDISKWIDTAFELYDQKKYNEAFEIFQKAVLEGSPAGDYGVGLCYLFGEGVGKDEFKGATFIMSAAMSGLVQAQYALGIIYRDGIGYRMDLVKAKEWFQRAAANGSQSAAEALEELQHRK